MQLPLQRPSRDSGGREIGPDCSMSSEGTRDHIMSCSKVYDWADDALSGCGLVQQGLDTTSRLPASTVPVIKIERESPPCFLLADILILGGWEGPTCVSLRFVITMAYCRYFVDFQMPPYPWI